MQKVKADSMQNVYHHIEDLRKLRFEPLMNKEAEKKKFLFCNLDEVAIQLDGGDSTYDFRGVKEVSTLGVQNGKIRFTAVLSILSDGNYLPPLLIFKSRKKISDDLKLQFDKLALIESNQTGWNNAELTKLWVETIWKSYKVSDETQKVLIWDKFSGHCDSSVKDACSLSKVFYIPSGCTHLIQPLDTHINKGFKDSNCILVNGLIRKAPKTEQSLVILGFPPMKR